MSLVSQLFLSPTLGPGDSAWCWFSGPEVMWGSCLSPNLVLTTVCSLVAHGAQVGRRVLRKLWPHSQLSGSLNSRSWQVCTRERSTTFLRPCERQRRRLGPRRGARGLQLAWPWPTWHSPSSVTSSSAGRRRARPVSRTLCQHTVCLFERQWRGCTLWPACDGGRLSLSLRLLTWREYDRLLWPPRTQDGFTQEQASAPERSPHTRPRTGGSAAVVAAEGRWWLQHASPRKWAWGLVTVSVWGWWPHLPSSVPLVLGSTELLTYPALVVDKMLKALKFHSSEARLKFPRLLQIIAQYPEETLGLMTREVSVLLPATGTWWNLRPDTQRVWGTGDGFS